MSFFFLSFFLLGPEVFEDTSKEIFFDSPRKMLAHVYIYICIYIYLTYLKSPHTFLSRPFLDSEKNIHHI